jgi:hypothetical protein
MPGVALGMQSVDGGRCHTAAIAAVTSGNPITTIAN